MTRPTRHPVRDRALAVLLGLTLGATPIAGGLSWLGSAVDPVPEYGFEACWELPRVRPDDRCGTDNGGPVSWPWIEGPHESFGDFRTWYLARASLLWFESASEGERWQKYTCARLELTYPNEDLRVTARHAPDSSWEEELQSWFECFPPTDAAPPTIGPYSWSIYFGERGRVRGGAATDSAAVERMQATVRRGEASALFARPSFSLTFGERRSSHEMDSYVVYADDVDELDELPTRLCEKRAQYARD